ncbi:MAG: hypothetical protein JEZ07_14655 [Phycisphaerae bacterium]|nr:hypothetical protein [Phycisphaerae bacterium]
MDEINLLEKLKDTYVVTVCKEIKIAADEFSLNYCFRNDCQHTTSNISLANIIQKSSENLKIKDLINNPAQFEKMRYLLNQVFMPRGLENPGISPYDTHEEYTEFISYLNQDDFLEKVSNKIRCNRHNRVL